MTKTFRLRSLQLADGVSFANKLKTRRRLKQEPVVMGTTSGLKDWIVVTCPADTPPSHRTGMARQLRKLWGDKVAVFPDDIKLFVFEEVED